MTKSVDGAPKDWNEKMFAAWELAFKTFITSVRDDEANESLVSGVAGLPKELRNVPFALGPIFKFLRRVQQKNVERNTKIAALEARVAALEDTSLKAGGTWTRGQAYAKNETVQHDGSLWRCCESHTSGASFSHEHFILVVKRGRDGRDAR